MKRAIEAILYTGITPVIIKCTISETIIVILASIGQVYAIDGPFFDELASFKAWY